MMIYRLLNKIYIVILFAGLFLIGYSFWRQLNFADNKLDLRKQQRLEVRVGEVVRQKFMARRNNLNRIGILFGKKSLPKDRKLNIWLMDEKCQNKLRQRALRGPYSFNSEHFYYFNFKPLQHSAFKNYCLQIEQVPIIVNDKRDQKGKIRLFVGTGDASVPVIILDSKDIKSIKSANDWHNKSKIKDEPRLALEGKGLPLVLRTYYNEGGLILSAQELVRRMSQYKPWFLKGVFLWLLLALLAVLHILLIKVLFFGHEEKDY